MSGPGPGTLLRCGTLLMSAKDEEERRQIVSAWHESERERLRWLRSIPAPTAEQIEEAARLETRLRNEGGLEPAGGT